jgi:hypothetical protein
LRLLVTTKQLEAISPRNRILVGHSKRSNQHLMRQVSQSRKMIQSGCFLLLRKALAVLVLDLVSLRH